MDSYTEHINATKAEKLLCNFDTLAVLFDDKDEFKNRETQKTILKKLIIKTRHQGRTSYRTGKNKDYGRLYADSASLQQLKKGIRNTICEDLYDDIDMKKSAPTVLLWLGDNYKIKMKNLYSFVKTDNYKHLKKHVNDILFGGNVPENIDLKDKKYLLDLKSQMFLLYDKLMNDPKYAFMLNHIKENRKWNIEGALCADVYQYIEADILREVFIYLSNIHVDTRNDVKMYDGFQHYPKNTMTNDIIDNINTHIFNKMTIPVKFVVKPFENVIDTTGMSNNLINDMFNGDDNYAEQKYSFEKDYAKIINSSLFIKTTGDEFKQFSESKLIIGFKHLCYYTEKKTKGKSTSWVKRDFIQDWLRDPKMRLYDDMDTYPPPMVCPNNNYNLWMPFEAENIPQLGNDLDAVEFFKNHVHIMCNHDQTITDTILKWNGQMLQFPSIKTFVPTFISKQGAGKGSWLEIMGKIIGGSRLVDTPKPSQHIFGDFNGQMANAFLVCMNEMEKKEIKDAEGYLKTLVTDPTILINKKGVESFKIRSFHRFVIFSNKDDPVMTSEDDRRNLIIRSSDELICKTKNRDYWKRMRQIINDPNAIKSIYNYLMSIPDLDSFHLDALPKTEYQQDLVIKNEPIQLQFIKWLITNDQFKHNNEVVPLKAQEIMTQFKIYRDCMHLEGYNTLAAPALLLMIKNLNLPGITKHKTKICNVSMYDMKAIRDHFTAKFIPDPDEPVEAESESEDEVETDD
jgi:hypothetical protein